MKKYFGLLGFAVFTALLLATCVQPYEEAVRNGSITNTGNETDGNEEDEWVPSVSSVFRFNFESEPLVFKDKDSIKSGAVAGTFTALGGSKPYSYELVDNGGDDYALFEIEGTKLKIAGAENFELPLDVYSVLVRVEDSEGATFEKYCLMQVILAPSPIRIAPKLYPYTVNETDNKIKVMWTASTGADGYYLYINDTGIIPANNAAADYTFNGTTNSDAYESREWEINTYNENLMPRNTTYYVWVKAYNDEGATLPSPMATVKTFQPVDSWFYEGVDYFTFAHADGYLFTPTTVQYTSDTANLNGFTMDILHHEVFAPEDVAIYIPTRGIFGEDIAGMPAGVFITKIHDDDMQYSNNGNPYTAVYYWGKGFTWLATDGNTYTRSYIINPWGKIAPAYPEKASYEEALEAFTVQKFMNWAWLSVDYPYTRVMSE